ARNEERSRLAIQRRQYSLLIGAQFWRRKAASGSHCQARDSETSNRWGGCADKPAHRYRNAVHWTFHDFGLALVGMAGIHQHQASNIFGKFGGENARVLAADGCSNQHIWRLHASSL